MNPVLLKRRGQLAARSAHRGAHGRVRARCSRPSTRAWFLPSGVEESAGTAHPRGHRHGPCGGPRPRLRLPLPLLLPCCRHPEGPGHRQRPHRRCPVLVESPRPRRPDRAAGLHPHRPHLHRRLRQPGPPHRDGRDCPRRNTPPARRMTNSGHPRAEWKSARLNACCPPVAAPRRSVDTPCAPVRRDRPRDAAGAIRQTRPRLAPALAPAGGRGSAPRCVDPCPTRWSGASGSLDGRGLARTLAPTPTSMTRAFSCVPARSHRQ
jgi:hypothetical protein